MTLLMLTRNNFISHQTRILELEASPSVFPTGTVVPYGGTSAPSGWLLCSGATVSRATYPDLFAICGTKFNTGGEAGTDFRLPDTRGRAVIGSGTGSGLTARTIGDLVGIETETLVTAEMLPSHTHVVTDPGHTHKNIDEQDDSGSGSVAFSQTGFQANSGGNGLTTANATTGITFNNHSGGSSHANVQPSLVMNFLVKT